MEQFPLVKSLAKSQNNMSSFLYFYIYFIICSVPNEKSKSCCFISDVDKLEDSGGGWYPSSPRKLLN